MINTDPSAGALYLDQPLARASDAEARRAGEYVVDHCPDPKEAVTVIAMLFAPLRPCRSRHHTGGPA